jgi:high affinity Mn2+ porin
MGSYDEALRLAAGTGAAPDTADVRRSGHKSGWALNVEQELAAEVGAFLRLSVSDGHQEAFEFTEINRSVSGGVVLKGALWGQPAHAWGMAVAVNGLSGDAVRYFRAGGMGILIGDGQLPSYGQEQVVETYYSVKLRRDLTLAGNCQRISNPAYNRDRGPVNIVGLRVHAEF